MSSLYGRHPGFSRSFEEYLERLTLVLKAVERAGLILQAKKCLFGSSSTKYLGHVVNREGVSPYPEKVAVIVQFPAEICERIGEIHGHRVLLSTFRRRLC